MKYIKSRDNFLTGIREFKDVDKYKNFETINEDSGPLANDIAWGDSLLGRLIHHVVRKAKINANLVRVKGVVRRLRNAMDDLINGSAPASLEGEDKVQYRRMMVFTFLDELNAAIEKGFKVGIIKNLTDGAIESVKNFEDFDGKNTLIAQLEDFKKFLQQFKDDDEGKEDPTIEGEDKEDKEVGDEEGDEEGDKSKGDIEAGEKEGSAAGDEKKSSEQMFTMIENLKALGLVLETYKRVKIAGGAANKTKITYTTVEGDTVAKIQANVKANPKKLSVADIRSKNAKNLSAYPKDNVTVKPGLVLVMESDSFYLYEAIGEGGGKDRGNIKAGEDHLTQAFTKLKKDLEILESSKEKGLGIDTKFISSITANYKDSKAREAIKGLYAEVNRYLVGDKKATIQEKDKLFNESVEIISDKNKKAVVAEKIARFSKRALQFHGQGLYGGLGDLSKPLEKYVNTLKTIMTYSLSGEKKEGGEEKKESKFKVGDKVSWTNKEGKKISNTISKVENGEYFFKKEDGGEFSKKEDELKKESILRSYDSYVRLIKEADESQAQEDEGKVSAPEKPTALTKIRDYWQKNVDFKQYVIDKTEYTKIKTNLEKKMQANKDAVVLQMDPVLDIVKCFNRAYKLHTTQVIPSARSGGKVTNAKFMEYTCFGTGSPENAGTGGGPYRNNAIFNSWEDAVLDIMQDKKYQPIFAKGTRLNNGGKMIEDAGSNLRKFMDDMLDGEDLYKTGKDGKGAQSKFLDKYFGYKEGDKAESTTFGGEEERQEIETSSTAIAKATKEVKFVEDKIKFENADDLVGTFFTVTGTGYDAKQLYFFIHSASGGYFYVTYTIGFKYYHDVMVKAGASEIGNPKMSSIKGNSNIKMPETYSTGKDEYVVKATRIPVGYFDTSTGKMKKNKYFSTYIQKKKVQGEDFSNKSKETEKIEEKEIISFKSEPLILAVLEGETVSEPKRVKIKNFDAALQERGIFPNIKSTPEIDRVQIKLE